MKKVLIIGLIVALAFIIIGGAGVVYARVSDTDNNRALTLTRYTSGDEVVRLYSYSPGSVFFPGCSGNDEQGYGPGGMMQGYGPGGMMQGLWQ